MANLTPMKAIRAKCVDCSGGNRNEVRFCTVEKCALHPYRMGKRPKADNSSTATIEPKKVKIADGFSPNTGTVAGEVMA